MLHHLMIGTWTPPGRIYTVAFDDEALTLTLVKKTEIPQDEPISWMTFDVRFDLQIPRYNQVLTTTACQEKHIRRGHEKVVQLRRAQSDRYCP